MKFRLKPMYSDIDESPALYAEKDSRYTAFLEENREIFDPLLLELFGCDFFHDGSIRGLAYVAHKKELTLILECPNIERGDRFIEAEFSLLFSDVSEFHLSFSGEFEAQELTYLSGEIDFLQEDGAVIKNRLSFLADPGTEGVVVFERLEVQSHDYVYDKDDSWPTYSGGWPLPSP